MIRQGFPALFHLLYRYSASVCFAEQDEVAVAAGEPLACLINWPHCPGLEVLSIKSLLSV